MVEGADAGYGLMAAVCVQQQRETVRVMRSQNRQQISYLSEHDIDVVPPPVIRSVPPRIGSNLDRVSDLGVAATAPRVADTARRAQAGGATASKARAALPQRNMRRDTGSTPLVGLVGSREPTSSRSAALVPPRSSMRRDTRSSASVIPALASQSPAASLGNPRLEGVLEVRRGRR